MEMVSAILWDGFGYPLVAEPPQKVLVVVPLV
jgi:hypothetical protein